MHYTFQIFQIFDFGIISYALDIKYSLSYLGEITGEITNDDVLSNIFSKFCIGK